MADLSQTAASVAKSTGGSCSDYLAGASITAGNAVYVSAANVVLLGQADGTAIESGVGTRFGIAEHAAATGQPVRFQETGTINVGATLTVGVVYGFSATAGAICPITDITTTNHYKTVLGIATSSTILNMDKLRGATGVQVP